MSAAVRSITRVTPDEAAKRLRVSRATVYRLVAEGELPAFRAGKRGLRILCDAIDAFEARQQVVVSAARIATSATDSGGRTSRASGGSRSARGSKRTPSASSDLPSNVNELSRLLGMRPKNFSP